MFCNRGVYTILVIITLITKNIQILGTQPKFNGNFVALENSFNKFLKQNVYKPHKYQLNKKTLDEREYGKLKNIVLENQTPIFYDEKDLNEDFKDTQNQNDYQNMELNYDDESYNYKMGNFKFLRSDYPTGICRREALSSAALQNSSLYPSVLTKALEIRLNPSSPSNSKESFFSNVAQKMNTTTLDLAAKIATSEPSSNENLFQYNNLSGQNNSASNPTNVENLIKNLGLNLDREIEKNNVYLGSDERFDGVTRSSLATILNRVLNKLDSIKTSKNNNEEHPNGAPCGLVGSWSSTMLGFCFDIQLVRDSIKKVSPAEVNNEMLSIMVSECIPKKHHQIIDLDWKFTGSAMKQWGGPFYLYGQKRKENVAATFLGFCRTCSGIDTIFGSWNIVSPSKDCHDISLANDVKRDILKRVRMEIKKRERLKEFLYQNRFGNV